jgi:hypothetical protein
MTPQGKIFLVDTNVFITPFEAYYPFDFAPSFWTFLETNILNGNIKVLSKVYDEVTKGNDDLAQWIARLDFKQIDHREPKIQNSYGVVLAHIQTSRNLYTARALAEWSKDKCADGWLVATAMAYRYELITFERPNGSLGINVSRRPKIPDVANHFGVQWGNLFEMMRFLGFKFL